MVGTLALTVYDRHFRRTGFVGDFISFTCAWRRNAQGTGELKVPDDHTYLDSLSQAGARLVADYAPAPGIPVKRFSGRLTQVGGEFTLGGIATFIVVDDFSVFTSTLGWPNPGQSLDHQGQDDDTTSGTGGAYDVRSGAAETVFKGAVAANAARLGLPVTVAPVPPSGARGGPVTLSLRMHPLADRAFPLVTAAGISVVAAQGASPAAGVAIDVRAPATYRQPLSLESGVVTGGSWTAGAPTATRVVVGGAGEGVDRDFISVVDAATESAWGVIEVFVDARDAGSAYTQALDASRAAGDEYSKSQQDYIAAQNDYLIAEQGGGDTDAKFQAFVAAGGALADKQAAYAAASAALSPARTAYLAALAQRGADALAAGAPQYKLDLTLTDTDAFAYGVTYDVGDLVPVQLRPGLVVTDAVTAVQLTCDGNGLLIAPTVGEGSDVVGLQARAIAALARAQRNATAGT